MCVSPPPCPAQDASALCALLANLPGLLEGAVRGTSIDPGVSLPALSGGVSAHAPDLEEEGDR